MFRNQTPHPPTFGRNLPKKSFFVEGFPEGGFLRGAGRSLAIDFRVLQKVTWIVYTLDYISQRLSFWPKLMAGHVGAGHVRPNVTQKGGRGGWGRPWAIYIGNPPYHELQVCMI